MPLGYVTLGEGPEKVLVLHGWLTDHTVFQPAMPWLDRTRFTWAFADARGYGRSRAVSGACTMAEWARDALDLADRLGWDRFHVVAHGMGSKAALPMAAHARERIAGVVLVAPLPPQDIALNDLRDAFEEACSIPAARGLIMTMMTSERLGARWQDEMTAASVAAVDGVTLRGYFNAWADVDLSPQVSGLDARCAILLGRHDPGFDEDQVRELIVPAFGTATVRIIEEAGHYPMMETPPLFARDLNAVLDDFAARG